MKVKTIIFLLYIHLLLSYSAGIGEGFTEWLKSLANTNFNGGRKKRGLMEFHDVITCLQPWVDILATYADYGCYCGFFGSGRPLDDTDKCCYLHDHCYDMAEMTEKTFSESISGMYMTSYKFDCSNNSKITCRNDLNTPYQQQYCECDRLAAECFLYSRRTYNEKLFNIDSNKYCSKDADLSSLQLGVHTMNKLYSCDMKMHDDKCCLEKGYNSVYEECCAGKLEMKLTNHECCGQEYYEKHEDVSCCFDALYNTTTHGCCGDEVYDITKNQCKENKSIPLDQL